ncbi:MAG: hypothetical protein Salg2KO_19160 [Salibacteraceae bacterium]
MNESKILVLGDSHARSFSYNNNFIPVFLGAGKLHNFISDHNSHVVLEKSLQVIQSLRPKHVMLFFGEPDTRYLLGKGWTPWDPNNDDIDGIDQPHLEGCVLRYFDFIQKIVRNASLESVLVLNIIPSKRAEQNAIVDEYNEILAERLGQIAGVRFLDINDTLYESITPTIKDKYVSDPVHLNHELQKPVEKKLLDMGLISSPGFSSEIEWDNSTIHRRYKIDPRFGCYVMPETKLTTTVERFKNLEVSEINSALNLNGVCIVDEYLDPISIDALQKDFELYLDQSERLDFVQAIEYSAGTGRKVFLNKLDSGSATAEVFGSEQFESIAHAYLKEDFELNKEIFVVEDVPASDHVAQQLHYDIARTLKFFIYLEDTTVENGAFYCVPGSHKWTAKMRKKYADKILPGNREFTRKLTDEYGPAVPIEGKAGTLIIFDTDVFHQAGKVSSGRRRVMRGHTRTIRSINERKAILNKQNRPTIKSRIKQLFWGKQ